MYDYHFLDENGFPNNAISLDTILVVPPKPDSRFTRLPIFITPVGGLPDTGIIQTGNTWQDHFGESILATNEGMNKNYNRILTFTQQLLRDTANPRWYEKITGSAHILKKEEMFMRGAVFTMGINDDIGTVPMPAIPIELRTTVYDYQAMNQRGLFPYMMFGNLQQQITSPGMAQMASAAMQILSPYSEAYIGIMSDIDTYWAQALISKTVRLPDFEVETKDLLTPITVEVKHDIEIPGYSAMKADMARKLDPNFKLSTETVISMLYPEIRDINREMARGRKNDAMNTPEAIMISQIAAYQEEAEYLRQAKDTKQAALFDTLANNLINKLKGAGQTQPPPSTIIPQSPQTPYTRPQPQTQPGMME